MTRRRSWHSGIFMLALAAGMMLAAAANAACTNPTDVNGAIIYNEDQNAPQACINGQWVALGVLNPGAGSGVCSTPDDTEGAIVYNADYGVLQYCDGTNWMAIGMSSSSGAVNACNVATDNLLVHYQLDESSGAGTASDSSGNGHDGTLTGMDPATDWITAGKVSGALDFDGSNDRVVLADQPSLDITGSGTLSAWVYRNSTGTWDGVISKGNTNDATINYGIDIGSNDLVYCVVCNGTACDEVTSVSNVGSIDSGRWIHLACSWDGSQLKVYVDGSLNQVASQTITPVGNAGPLSIGQWGGDTDRYHGMIDDVRIYTRALTGSEIWALGSENASCGGGGGCTAPASCPNIGDVCSDGSLFAGFMLYGGDSCESLYVTDNNQSAATSWRPSANGDYISPDSHVDGRANAANRSGSIANFPAFELCESNTYHGKSDWYLPAHDELALLWKNRAEINANAAGSFVTTYYWSSTEATNFNAWTWDFAGAYNDQPNKGSAYDVRCVRRD